jgi:hypothetical protein
MDLFDANAPRFTILDDPLVDPPQNAVGRLPIRGIGWVLRWAATAAVLAMSLVRLACFGFQLAAEQTLAKSARAGALEATLPRASYESVAQTVERRLGGLVQPSSGWKLYLEQNGKPVRSGIRLQEGDCLSVALVLPGQSALPGWLRPLNLWVSDRSIEARAERRIPGRQLPDRRIH